MEIKSLMFTIFKVEAKSQSLNKLFLEYNFLFIEVPSKSPYIFQDLNQSKMVIVDVCSEENDLYFIICFEKTVIIINQNKLSDLISLFPEDKLIFFFLSNSKELFNQKIENKYEEVQNYLNIDYNIIESNPNYPIVIYEDRMKKFSCKIKTCLITYLAQVSLFKANENRLLHNNKKNNTNTNTISFKPYEYIELGIIGDGSLFLVKLIYYFPKKELLVIKSPKYVDDNIYEKLINREKSNYENIDCPLIPKFYGKIKIPTK